MDPRDSQPNRGRSDRRRRPTRAWDFLFTPARRKTIRRTNDPSSYPYHFVDQPGQSTIIWTLSLLMLTLIDGVLTLLIIADSQGEANPVMAYLIRRGVLWFILGKYAMTVAALPVLLIFKNYRMFGTSVRVGHTIPVLVSLYLALTCSSAFMVFASSRGVLIVDERKFPPIQIARWDREAAVPGIDSHDRASPPNR
jgi:hypothetical protein